MSLRSLTEHENTDLRHAGMDSRHPGSQGCFRRHPCRLDSSTPCWNDAREGPLLNVTEALRSPNPFFKEGEVPIREGR